MYNPKYIFSHKNFSYLLISWWASYLGLCCLGLAMDMKDLGAGAILGVVFTPVVFIIFEKYRKKSENFGKKIFFTKLGYIFAGISLGLITLATTFNIMYQPDWFNFTDFFFVIFSMPLSALLKFNPNSGVWLLRAGLFGITFLNLAIVTIFFDLVAEGFLRLISVFKKR